MGKTMKQWEREQTAKRYAEMVRLRLVRTGKAETATQKITYSESTGWVQVCADGISVTLTMAQFLKHSAEILEAGKNLPLLRGLIPETVVRNYKTLPDYGPKRETYAEKYAERLRKDRWDVRKNGDPCNWRLQK